MTVTAMLPIAARARAKLSALGEIGKICLEVPETVGPVMILLRAVKMTNDPSDPKSNSPPDTVDVFCRPPTPEEIDKRIISSPRILRNRLTFDAYATRCRLLGQEPNIGEWLQHLKLSDE